MIAAAYIHIPFCEHICHYCDFNKVFIQHQPVDAYLEALEKEIALTCSQYPSAKKLQSIFVGGGTPTVLNEQQLEKLVTIISNHLIFDDHTEFTFEANPGDLSEAKFRILKNAHVNRLSFGVQTFRDELLESIGRTHRAKDVLNTIEKAVKHGFANISIDLMYGLPKQTLEDFSHSLLTAVSLPITHLSSYSLIVEPKTVFYNLLQKGRLLLPSEDDEADMYEKLMETMEANGFRQYEISNFAKPNYESCHNLTYWNNDSYYGFGAGAHSYVDRFRRANVAPINKYIEKLFENKLPLLETHQVTKQEQMEEEMFLGLRKMTGVSIQHFLRKYQEDPLSLFAEEIRTHVKQGLLEIDDDHIRLTHHGKLLGNEVFQSFIGIIQNR